MSETTDTPCATITIQASFDGFPVTIAWPGKVSQIPGAIQRLQAIGAVALPDVLQTAESVFRTADAVLESTNMLIQATGSSPAASPASPPVCAYHGAMKESTKVPGTWFCAKKMGDGSYCKEKWPK